MRHFQFTIIAVMVIGLVLLWQNSQAENPSNNGVGTAVVLEPQPQLVYELDNEFQVPLQATHEQILHGFAHHMYQVAGVFRHINTVERAKANLGVLETVIYRFQRYHQQYEAKLHVTSHPKAAQIMQPAKDAMDQAIVALEAQPDIIDIVKPVTDQYSQQ